MEGRREGGRERRREGGRESDGSSWTTEGGRRKEGRKEGRAGWLSKSIITSH